MCLFLPANVCMCTTLQMQKVPPSPSSFPPKHTHTCAGAHAIHRKCLSVCLSLSLSVGLRLANNLKRKGEKVCLV